MDAARFGRLQPETFECAQVGVVQLPALAVFNDIAFAAPFDVHPHGIEAVKNASDAPLICRALHTV